MGSDIVGLAFYDIVWDAHQQYVKLPILKNIYKKNWGQEQHAGDMVKQQLFSPLFNS
jgi:hypothetical protein